MYVCLCVFYWGSSLCTFALKQMDFNWRDQTLSVTERRNRLNIISKLKPQTIQHITLIISLSLSHTHSVRFLSERRRSDSLCISETFWIWYFSVLKSDCAKGWITVPVWFIYFLYVFISLILGYFLDFVPLYWSMQPGLSISQMWSSNVKSNATFYKFSYQSPIMSI